jgi:hypothetical protein
LARRHDWEVCRVGNPAEGQSRQTAGAVRGYGRSAG